jgi:hypothetical protein
MARLEQESIAFTATDAGFKDGLGGASNAHTNAQNHYVLFGIQEDRQHPWNSGVYFEFDSQSNGCVNSVQAVSIGDKVVRFVLRQGLSITVTCDISDEKWTEFKAGITVVFPDLRTDVNFSGPLGQGDKRHL